MRLKRPLFLGSAVLLPLFVGATLPHFADHLRTFTVGTIQPFLELQSSVVHSVKSGVQYLSSLPTLHEENENLKVELEDLKAELNRLEEIKRENARLESLLRLKERMEGRAFAARVIGRDPSHWSQFVVINKGNRDGVRGNTVLVHPNGLVGKVVAAGRRSARAILLVDAESRVSAMNQRTRDVGLIQGGGSPMLKMTYLDRFSDIQVGDIIVSSGLGGIYPKAIPIGKVEIVGMEKDRLKLYALVRPYVSFSKLEEVLCIPSQAKEYFLLWPELPDFSS